MRVSFTRVDARAAASPTPTGLNTDYGGNLDVAWNVDADGGGAAASGSREELWFEFDRYSHLPIERDELEVCSSFNDLLDWLTASARTGSPLFAPPSGDIATPGTTALRNHITLLEKQLQAGEENLKGQRPILPVKFPLPMSGFGRLAHPPSCNLSNSLC